ncbi:hypothetical protein TrVE_jg14508 [Triparma verrucosa]|uniref:Uncharacterized protein n=1 Tax=Triparma verrucosa TaxID=1606542 RepID=A0A9W6ZAI2_9STRA|nr:hypothetical protein TrVE_jg14508 [Triparma verrucosa]|eukprot:gene13621-2498_t
MAFDPALIELKWENHSENDEGDFDSYRTSIITYNSKEIWRHSTSSHSNIGGAWGSEHTAVLSADKKLVLLTVVAVSGDVSTGRVTTAQDTKTINIEKLTLAN